MSLNDLKLEALGYGRTLTKLSLFEQESFFKAEKVQGALPSFSTAVRPQAVASGELPGNLSVVQGYIKSANYYAGVNGWKVDAVGNAEFNTATIRGSVYATTGTIGGWVIDSRGLYYNGSGSPYIKTSASVGLGSDGVILDQSGIRVYDSVLGVVVSLPSDGSAPSFASGTITETTFTVSTNAVIRTSSTVGDGTSSSAGVLINNAGMFACEASQLLANANVRIGADGSAYFSGDIAASAISASDITGSTITGSVITGGMLRTAVSGQRLEITSDGVVLYSGDTGSTYGDATYKYNDSTRKYGTGVLAYINNSEVEVPIYFNAEQAVADIHLYNRSANPTGAAEIGDLAVVNGRLMICKVAGTPGGWAAVGDDAPLSSFSPSVSPSRSPSVSPSISPSVSRSASPS